MATVESDPFIGERFGNFILLDKIGSGGMGTVYRAKQVGLDRPAAVKVLRPDLVVQNKNFVRRFLREAKTSALISHPNVVQVYTSGVKAGVHYIAMEFVDGDAVGSKLDKRGMLGEKEAISIIIQAARGLQAAGEKGLIHRDIKPDNLLVAPDGTVKVADFGLAKMVEMQSRLTREGVTIGTIAYMSPEQIRGESLDFRSDIYSLGSTLFHMLTGRQPFEGESAVGVAYKHIHEPVDGVRDVNPILSTGIDAVVRRMMAKDVEDRHQDIEELIEDLTEVLARGHPASTDTTSYVELGYRPSRGKSGGMPAKPLALGAGVLFLLIGGVVLILLAGGGDDPQDPPDLPPPPKKPRHQIVIENPAESHWLSKLQVVVEGRCGPGCREVKVNGTRATLKGERFHIEVWLVDKNFSLHIQARWRDGRTRTLTVPLNVDTTAPVLTFESPPEGRGRSREASFLIRGTCAEKNPGSLTLDGAQLPATGGPFEVRVKLPDSGERTFKLEAIDLAGNRTEKKIVLVRDRRPPGIKILSRVDGSYIESASNRYTLRFEIDEAVTSVTVNGKPLPSRGKLFQQEILLKEGVNHIIIKAVDLAGNPGQVEEALSYKKKDVPVPVDPQRNFRKVLDVVDKTEKLTDKIAVLEAYLKTRPPPGLEKDAAQMLRSLRTRLSAENETQVYETTLAMMKKSKDPYEQISLLRGFLGKYPEGRYELEVTDRIQVLRRKNLPTGVLRGEKPGEYLNEKDGAVMVLMPQGRFPMGGRDRDLRRFLKRRSDLDIEAYEDELKVHTVELDAFFIYKYEVTNEQFARFLTDFGSLHDRKHRQLVFPSEGGIQIEEGRFRAAVDMREFPVVEVTWYGAAKYAEWANARLPTEAQWEMAATWDPVKKEKTIFPWGNDSRYDVCNTAEYWFKGLIKTRGDWTRFKNMRLPAIRTLSVRAMPGGASPIGCHHMTGNVWEWCRDWYSKSYYKLSPVQNPVQTKNTYVRVIRGGSYARSLVGCRGTRRQRWGAREHGASFGFRCVRPAK